MQALFIGQTYIDVTFLADRIPAGDEKAVAEDFAVSFGGNAVTAAFACSRLGIRPELLTTLAEDWLGSMFRDMAARYGILIHARRVARSSLSFVMPKDGQRAIIRCRDNDLLDPVPELDLAGCRALHLDGHQPDAAIAYARECRQAGILTSLDGGTIRPMTMELLDHIDVAVVSEEFCAKLGSPPGETLGFLHGKGCKVAAVTLGKAGAIWSEAGGPVVVQPALPVPASRVIDSNGAGDVFHGAYVYSYLADPRAGWPAHFDFARAASAHAIQHLGNEASLPTLRDIAKVRAEFAADAAAQAQAGRAG
jgi:sugar/nucleoside kinase (ribokinase family)